MKILLYFIITTVRWNVVEPSPGETEKQHTSEYIQQNEKVPSHLVVAPRIIRPGTLYGVVVTLLGDPESSVRHMVKLEINRNGVPVAGAAQEVVPFLTQTMFMKIPQSSKPGMYKLRIQGNYLPASGGTMFLNETELVYSPHYLAIIVQTSKPVYCAGQAVYFRIILLTTDLMPYEDTVNVYVVDSDGFIMRRWVSMQNNNGVISHKFTLPSLVKPGAWKIRVEAQHQIEEQNITVENYFIPLFEVHVTLPTYILDHEEEIKANVEARSELQRIARGNATFRLYGNHLTTNGSKTLIWEDKSSMKHGKHEVVVRMEDVRSVLGDLLGVELRLEAELTDLLHGETVLGFSHTRIINSSLNLYFLGSPPLIFKPGMPYEGHVVVAYYDKEHVDPEKLSRSTLRIKIHVYFDNGGSTMLPDIVVSPVEIEEQDQEEREENEIRQVINSNKVVIDRYREEGIFCFKFDVPTKATKLQLQANYNDRDGSTAYTKISVLQYYSPHRKFLNIRTSTDLAITGEFAIFHVKTNFRLSGFQYLIISKGLLLYAGEQSVNDASPTITTFAVPVSVSMTPAFRVLVYHITEQREVVADSIFMAVDGFTQYEIYLVMNQGKDHTKRSAEAVMNAEAGAFMGIQAQRSSAYITQAGNDISKSRVMASLYMLENSSRAENKVTWRSRDGMVPDENVYFSSTDYGVDSNTTFVFASLVIITDAMVPNLPRIDACNFREGYLMCLTEGCFLSKKKCDGYRDCEDGSDESECPPKKDDQYEYRLSRMSRSSEFYDTTGGDWGWTEMNGEYGGEEFFRLDTPSVTDDWYFTGFSVSKVLGFATIDTPVPFSSMRPFMMHMEGPSSCHRGEQVGLRLLLVNNEPYEMLVILMLHGSSDYKFVHVEENGIVSSYNARVSGDEHHHLVYLSPRSQQQVDMPITPSLEQGDITVTVTAVTQVGRMQRSHNIKVMAEGGRMNKHTSVFLDLKTRAIVLRYMAIYVEESPIVPYEVWRRYIFGSTSGSVTLSSDIIGPVFPGIPLTSGLVLGTETKGTEARVFELAANTWTLHYLRLTNQLKLHTTKQVLEEANALFSQIMRCYDKEGWFKNWDNSHPSVWLTAWTIRIFKHASFQDWEDYFYVEPTIFKNSVRWLLQYQMESGYFSETSYYNNPLDQKMQSKASKNLSETHYLGNVTLTAHVLITLHEVMGLVQGKVKTKAVIASIRATRYLEQLLPRLKDPYEIAITAYALTISESTEKDTAFTLLQLATREEDGFLYWSREAIPGNVIKYENQRPFIRPREYQECDSLAVESTSFALLVYLIREGVTIITEKIMQWLNTVRMSNNGFISSIDTVIAMQALTEYAFRARLMDITDINVTVEMPSSDDSQKSLHVGNVSYTGVYNLEIPNVWGHVNIVARGSGQAIVQMDVNYGIDYEDLVDTPTKESFELVLREYYSTYRNKSAITIQSCMRWTRQEPSVSGAAVLEVDLPTGYILVESNAVKIVESGVHPTLRDAKTVEGKTIWFFDYVSRQWTCFNHTVYRWFPVANMTLYRQALLYEAYAREHFIHVLVNSTPLYVLNICEVCGSYQCPYCPFYSEAGQCIASSVVIFCLGLLAFVKNCNEMMF